MKKILLIICFLLWASTVRAGTYWVSTSGSDSNGCTNTTTPQTTGAKRSINAGIECARVAGGAPHTINVRSGTYGEVITGWAGPLPTGTSDTNRIFLKAYDGAGTVTMNGSGGNGGAVILLGANGVTSHYWEVDGFNLDATNSSTGLSMDGSLASNDRFKNMDIANVAVGLCPPGNTCGPGHAISQANIGVGIGVNQGSSHNEFINIAIHDSTSSLADQGGGNCCQGAHGGYISGDSNTFDRLHIYNMGQHGIQMFHYGDLSSSFNNTLKNSVIHDNGTTGLSSYCVAANGDNTIVFNMICYNQPTFGVGMGPNAKVYNSTFYNMPTGVTDGGAARTGLIIRNNLFSSVGTPVDVGNSGSGATHDHNGCAVSGTGCDIVGSLNFVNAAGHDFSLGASGSAAIDVGTSSIASGITLTCAGVCDLGVYEVPKFASCSATGNTLSITFDNPRFPPISNLATTGITATVDGTSRSLTSPVLVGTNQMNLTFSGAAASKTVSTVGSSVAVTDSASIGGSTSNVQKAANWSSTPCTVGGSPPPGALLTQTHFRLHDLPGVEASPKCLSSSGSCTNMEGVNATVQKGGCFRCRAKISCTGAACNTAGYIFRYSKNGGGYSVVPDTFDSGNIRFYGTSDPSSEIPSQGTVTTAQLTSDFGAGSSVTDAFTNLTNFTGNYTSLANMAITSGRARSATLNLNAVESHNTSIGLNQYAQVVLSTFNTAASYVEGGVILRASNSPTVTFYYVVASHGADDSTYIYRFEGGAFDLVSQDASQTWAAGDTIKAKIEGSNISVYRNGSSTAFMTYTDGSPLTGTKAGAAIFVVDSLADVELDSFEAGQTNTGTVISGAFIRTSNAIPSITSPPQNSEWEIEGALCIDNDETVGSTYDFKLYNQDGTPLDTYSAIPRVTVAAPALSGGIAAASGLTIGAQSCTAISNTAQNCVATIGWQASPVDATHSMPTNYMIRRGDGSGSMAQIGSVLAANTSLQNSFTDSGGVNHCYDVIAAVAVDGRAAAPSNQACWTSPPLVPATVPAAPNLTVSVGRGYRRAA